ncbi:hypothetical protein GPJ56_009750 [Histomonas meleagridis]|uniref:uncharacterized protein n=1 Tax=Histomonas meleagridis TaxID=135588 RepID=UPI00355A5692|nr:hypothetical protein GPJ56_009750 [Histomonas meleagridis]KAH0802312.1 hypothetical protein GO595_004925 [Histomonas meleagridis]
MSEENKSDSSSSSPEEKLLKMIMLGDLEDYPIIKETKPNHTSPNDKNSSSGSYDEPFKILGDDSSDDQAKHSKEKRKQNSKKPSAIYDEDDYDYDDDDLIGISPRKPILPTRPKKDQFIERRRPVDDDYFDIGPRRKRVGGMDYGIRRIGGERLPRMGGMDRMGMDRMGDMDMFMGMSGMRDTRFPRMGPISTFKHGPAKRDLDEDDEGFLAVMKKKERKPTPIDEIIPFYDVDSVSSMSFAKELEESPLLVLY